MRVEYGMVCTNDECKEEYQVKCELDDLHELLKTVTCESCGSPLRRSWSVGAIKFNGTGWAGGGKTI